MFGSGVLRSHDEGYAYAEEWIDEVVPLMEQAGLRNRFSPAAERGASRT